MFFFSLKEENGGRIIERHNGKDSEKFESVKLETDDVRKLRDVIGELNQQMDLKRIAIDDLKQSNAELNKHFTVITKPCPLFFSILVFRIDELNLNLIRMVHLIFAIIILIIRSYLKLPTVVSSKKKYLTIK